MDKSRICQTCSASACGSLRYNSDTHTYYCPVFNIGYVADENEASTLEENEDGRTD